MAATIDLNASKARRNRAASILAAVVVQTVLVVWTRWVPRFGTPEWQHLASLLLAIAILVPFWRPLTSSRAFLGIGVFATTVLAVGSGFFILYWKPWLKAQDIVDWIKFWHVFWSWLALIFFVFHTWINRIALVHLWRRVHRSIGATFLLYGSLLAVMAVSAYTWTDWGKDTVGDPNYILLTWYAWLVVVAPAYAVWLGTVVGRGWAALAGLQAALPRITVRGFVDVALIPMTILANVSGFPITFWKEEVHGAGFKFAGKVAHTAPSILMAVLTFIHIVHLWRPTRSHWRKWGRPWARAVPAAT